LINPWAILAAVAIAIGCYFYGRADGKAVGEGEWKSRESAELVAANAKIVALEEDRRRREQKHADEVARISTNYQRQLSDAKRKRDSDVVAVRAGDIRLFDPGTRKGACIDWGREVGAAAGGRDGGACRELSREATEFLLGLAGEADEVALQLSACQALVRADREIGR
jgi:hypothetical protein